MPIIGLVGPFGSGCTTVSDTIIERGYIYVSLSNKLRELYSEKNPDKEPTRSAMQDFGNEIRETKGSSYLAQLIVKDISNAPDKTMLLIAFAIQMKHPIYARIYHSFIYSVYSPKQMLGGRG